MAFALLDRHGSIGTAAGAIRVRRSEDDRVGGHAEASLMSRTWVLVVGLVVALVVSVLVVDRVTSRHSPADSPASASPALDPARPPLPESTEVQASPSSALMR
jgi:hypothetical protein